MLFLSVSEFGSCSCKPVKEKMENVTLDTHICVFDLEYFVPIRKPWVHEIFISFQKKLIQKVQDRGRVVYLQPAPARYVGGGCREGPQRAVPGDVQAPAVRLEHRLRARLLELLRSWMSAGIFSL